MLKSDFKDIIKKACFKSRGRPFNGRLDKVRRVLQLQYLRLLRIVFYIGFRYNIKASCEFRKEAQQAQSSTVKENHGSLKTICFAVSIPYLVKAIFLLTKTELKEIEQLFTRIGRQSWESCGRAPLTSQASRRTNKTVHFSRFRSDLIHVEKIADVVYQR